LHLWHLCSGNSDLWDYDAVAEDLENGTVEILHPEMLPQRNR
jgi:hypothetical protein